MSYKKQLIVFQHSVTDVVKVASYHSCYSARDVVVIITVTAARRLSVPQSLSVPAGNVLSASRVSRVGKFQENNNYLSLLIRNPGISADGSSKYIVNF